MNRRFPIALVVVAGLGAVVPPGDPGRSAPGVRNIEYEIVFDRTTAVNRTLGVGMRFDADAAGAVELSLPAWTPGAYEISDFARHVSGLRATQGNTALRWDKTDPDTWRLQVPSAGRIEVRFTYTADSLDNAMAWARPEFVFVNGTNIFFYPEGAGHDFSATVGVRTEPNWTVATGMTFKSPGIWEAANYHDLVDMPFFIGRLDLDSAEVDGTWHRIASFPAGMFAGPGRRILWNQLSTMVPAMSKVFRETPWSRYTTLLVFDSGFGGGSALEHQNSHVGIYHPGFIGNPLLASITAHEIFHAWNVKRLRPADLVPYRYDRPQPTTLLWVSEGITDYYADLALVRGDIIDSTVFLNLTMAKMEEVAQVPAVALEDASLSTWIHPTDGTATIYYPKGSLAGFLLDIMIRDASGNRASLDDVMRSLYQTSFKQGRGFTTEQWWQAVSAAAGGKSFADFASRYIDGREPFPWATVVPLAGFRYVADTLREPRIGVATVSVEGAERVTTVAPGSSAAAAGVQIGDELVSVGEVKAEPQFGIAFRTRYRNRIGETVPVVVRREGKELSLSMKIQEGIEVRERLEFVRRPGFLAARVRTGILEGTMDPR